MICSKVCLCLCTQLHCFASFAVSVLDTWAGRVVCTAYENFWVNNSWVSPAQSITVKTHFLANISTANSLRLLNSTFKTNIKTWWLQSLQILEIYSFYGYTYQHKTVGRYMKLTYEHTGRGCWSLRVRGASLGENLLDLELTIIIVTPAKLWSPLEIEIHE